MDDMDFGMDETEEEEGGEEQQNRTFIILVAVMGGLLLIGIIAFCAWALIVGRGIIGSQVAAVPSETPINVAMGVELTTTAEARQGATTVPTTAPPATSTPRPTAVPPRPSPTQAAPARETAQQGTPAAIAQATPTIAAQPTQEATPAPTADTGAMANTGIGTFTAVILAAGLLLILITARRLRTAH